MKTKVALITILVLTLLPAAWAHGDKHGEHHKMKKTAFSEFIEHYEAIRLSLLSDSLDGIGEHARAISKRARRLASAFDAETAGVADDKSAAIKALLPKLREQADALAGSKDLRSARDAFAPLSESLVSYRDAATGDKPAVAFCPMAKRSWLQPKGQIGNPYGGTKMPRCGQFVKN
ncbi:MAG: DUF3347 domain-containing protein [Acidobacteriota bacterium]|nr:DUF3347 domain-containing protein [Acidobacteriota bacterium]